MEEIILQNKDGIVLASSRDVADRFNKRHTHILDTIKEYAKQISTAEFSALFRTNEYKASNGKTNTEYLMNRDGFSLLVMGFTGKKALEWKLKYIDAFNRMEEKLKSGNYLSTEEKLKLQLFSKDPLEVASAHNRLTELAVAPFIEKIEEQKPLVEFANKVSDSSNLIDMGEMAKLLKDEHIDIGRNRLFQWLRSNKILMSNNIPYQRYIDGGYFEVKESVYETPYGTKTQITTKVTGKGQIYITEKLRKELKVA